MKRLFLLLFFLSVSGAISAQSDKPRTWTQLSALNNGQKYDKSQARIFTVDRLAHWKEMSLKSFDEKMLNTIELDLMNKYHDVIVTRMFKCYFTLNEEGDIGINRISGEEIVPPVHGKVRQCNYFFLIGETSDDFEDLSSAAYVIGDVNQSYKVAYSAGCCKSVVRFHTKGITEIVPYGKFDLVSAVPYGISGTKGFYVCKLDENNEHKWGFYDDKGNEIVECKYKSIFFDGKEFKGNNIYTMEEILSKYEQTVNMKKEIREQRRQMWAEALNAVGQSMVAVGSSMQQSQSSGSAGVSTGGSSSKASGGGVDYLAQYRRWEHIAEQHYNSITNLGASVKYDDGTKSGSAGQSMSPANYVSMKKSYREAQQEMARIRRKAAQAGVSIPQSPWETNTISY